VTCHKYEYRIEYQVLFARALVLGRLCFLISISVNTTTLLYELRVSGP